MKIFTAVFSRMRFLDWLFLIACLAVFGFYVPLAISANSDLAAGRFALFMDERITFDGVKKILHPDGLAHFFNSVLNGGDHRYGRSLWNSIAIFSVIPERFFGEAGQIIAARMLQVILIVASYFVFGFGVLRSWFLRLVLLVAMLAMPFSDYYMTMPKPEPLQLLFLAIFSYFFVKKNAAFSWHWIFIGLAFGTKISTLPALLVFIAIALIAKNRSNLSSVCGKSVTNAAIAFFIGLAIAVPILFVPLLLSIGGYFAFDWLKKFFVNRPLLITIAITLIVTVYLLSRKFLNVWILSTFLNTTHGADQGGINALSWGEYIFDSWVLAPKPIGLVLFIFIFGYLILYGAQISKSDFSYVDKRVTAFAVAIAGLALNIAIIMGVKRLWGFYLYPGTTLLVVGIMMMADLNISGSLKTNHRALAVLNRYIAYFVSVFLLVISMTYWMPRTIDALRAASHRTNTPEYALDYSSYSAIITFLDNFKVAEGRRLRVMLTPSLFPPESNKKYEIVEFWGRYIEWDKEPDIIIFGQLNTALGNPPPKDSPNYSDFLIEREGYASHVAKNAVACKTKPCFVRELELPNGGEVLVLSKGPELK